MLKPKEILEKVKDVREVLGETYGANWANDSSILYCKQTLDEVIPVLEKNVELEQRIISYRGVDIEVNFVEGEAADFVIVDDPKKPRFVSLVAVIDYLTRRVE